MNTMRLLVQVIKNQKNYSTGLRPVLMYVTLSGFDVFGYTIMLKA
jgi:hypothetical protein